MLAEQGVCTAWDFAQLPREWVRRRMGVTGLRTWCELHGEACIGFEEHPADGSASPPTRTFDRDTEDFGELHRRIARYAALCAAKLRAQGSSVRRGVGVPAYEPLPRGPAPALRACRAAPVRAGRQYARTDRTGRGGCGASIAGVLPKRAGVILSDILPRCGFQERPVRCDRPCEARPADGGGRCAQCRIRTPPGRDRRRGCGPLPQHRDRLSRPFTTDWEGCCG